MLRAQRARDDDDYGALFNRGLTNLRRQDLSAALADFNAALQLRPDEPSIRLYRGGVADDLGDTATATLAFERLKAVRVQAESGSNAYRAKPFAIMEKEVGAALASAQKDTATAERLLKDATAIELTLDDPSGPAEPIKPSFELYGELLVELHRPAEAAAQFQHALQRMPNRRASLVGLERAAGQRPATAQPAGR